MFSHDRTGVMIFLKKLPQNSTLLIVSCWGHRVLVGFITSDVNSDHLVEVGICKCSS